MQPAAIRPEREDQRREILHRGLARYLRRDVEWLHGAPRDAVDNLVADLLIRYFKVTGDADQIWDLPHYGTLRRRRGEVIVPKRLRAIQDLPEGRGLVNRMIATSRQRPKVGASLRRYQSHALTELVLSLAATFRCLTEEGKTGQAYIYVGRVLELADIRTREPRRREGDDVWDSDSLFHRVCRAAEARKMLPTRMVEETGDALMTTDPILQMFRTGRKPPEPLVQAQGRYYRGVPV